MSQTPIVGQNYLKMIQLCLPNIFIQRRRINQTKQNLPRNIMSNILKQQKDREVSFHKNLVLSFSLGQQLLSNRKTSFIGRKSCHQSCKNYSLGKFSQTSIKRRQFSFRFARPPATQLIFLRTSIPPPGYPMQSQPKALFFAPIT